MEKENVNVGQPHKHRIYYKDLSGPLRFAATAGFIYGIMLVAALILFILGFILGLAGVLI